MKRFNVALSFALIFSVCISFARVDALCQDIRDNVFRLHIRANSDTETDQKLKLSVRDAILSAEGENFGRCEDLNEAINYAENNIEKFEQIALSVIKEQGFDYGVQISVCDSYFENREYDDFTLPAGVYKSLNINIGSGQGKNWWCVMFPAVCIGASANLGETLSDDSTRLVYGKDRYIVRFKTVEIYEDIKNYFKK